MRVFVTGATGVLGRGVIGELATAGHQVSGVARTAEKAAWLREHNVEPVAVDLFDGTAVKDAVAGSDAVLHLATSIPALKDVPKRHAWDTNNRLRTLTTRLLVDAALDHGVGTFVAESITRYRMDRRDRAVRRRRTDPLGDRPRDGGGAVLRAWRSRHRVAVRCVLRSRRS
jgi:nucleoside-diphosphate-sugar epimerase